MSLEKVNLVLKVKSIALSFTYPFHSFAVGHISCVLKTLNFVSQHHLLCQIRWSAVAIAYILYFYVSYNVPLIFYYVHVIFCLL